MGPILSEPINKVVEIPKKIAKTSVEDAKKHPKRPCRPRTSSGRKGRGGGGKHRPAVFSQQKRFSEEVVRRFCCRSSVANEAGYLESIHALLEGSAGICICPQEPGTWRSHGVQAAQAAQGAQPCACGFYRGGCAAQGAASSAGPICVLDICGLSLKPESQSNNLISSG
jgi:hypothetical protein